MQSLKYDLLSDNAIQALYVKEIETSINPHTVSETAAARITVTNIELTFLLNEIGPLPS